MPLFHLIVLAIVQGVTEFLPISSSAHLILVPRVLGVADQGLVLDVAVHVGTLVAVVVYFRRRVLGMVMGLGAIAVPGWQNEEARANRRLALAVIVGTIPVVIAGLAFRATGADMALRGILVIGWASLGFGLVLWIADRYAGTIKNLDDLSLPNGLVIGLAQILALVPGTSRAGITITAARALGFKRADAASFSMLLAIPTIAAAGVLSGYEVISAGDSLLGIDAAVAAALAFVAAYFVIDLFLRFVQTQSMTVFVVYRCGLGALLLMVGYGWLA